MYVFLQVSRYTCKKVSVEYNANISIAELKWIVTDREGIPPEEFDIYIGSHRLDTDLTLTDYNICDEAVLQLYIGDVFIQQPGQEAPKLVGCNLHRSVAELKESILKWHEVPIEEQTLFFEGRKLENVEILMAAGVKYGSEVVLVRT
mmetsp:Transcript_556/g.825  ORF Transcript_556/g.825 Transcript_556/m.825 type:complete len:147 (+) Transcript_556:168-608(+)